MGQVEKIYHDLEKIRIFTVNQVSVVDDHYLEMEVRIPPTLISSFREECRQDEMCAEGYGVSAPRVIMYCQSMFSVFKFKVISVSML